MVIAQEPAQSLAALDRPLTINVLFAWEEQDVALSLVIALRVVMLNVFAQRPPQRALAEQDDLRETFLFHRPDPALRISIQVRTAGRHRQRFDLAERNDGAERRSVLRVAGYKLLIIDELGYVPLSQTGAELLFEVFSQRYERGSTVVTSNLPFDEWTSVFGSERLTGALLDRLTHHVQVIAQKPAQSLAALDRPLTINVLFAWEEQDVALSLVIALRVVMLNVFAQRPPQRALAEQDDLRETFLR